MIQTKLPSGPGCHSTSTDTGWRNLLILLAISFAFWLTPRASAVNKQLSNSGTPLVQVVTKPGASARVQSAATDLATKLSQITGGTFTVTTGDGSTGIAVGLGSDFTSAVWPYGGSFFTPGSATGTEDYAIRSHADGVFVGGATDAGVEHAVSDLLYRLGYRFFFPGYRQDPSSTSNPRIWDWEIIPNTPTLSVDLDITESPAYNSRRIWYGYGDWSHNNPATNLWNQRNRMASGVEIAAGHSFATIVSRNLAAFTAHPEYLALVGGNRVSPTIGHVKFCLSNADLRTLIVNDTLAAFAANPSAQSRSLEPSDGGGWCECTGCAAMGSKTDQLMTLANQVAAAVDAVYPNQKYIGLYAYNEHCAPPTITVHPRVAVLVATGFTPGWNTDVLMAGWSAKGATIGVREYYAVTTSDRDLPGKAKAAKPDVIKTSIANFHDNHGAAIMSAESSAAFGPLGLGHYLATRYLWNTAEIANHADLIEDFLTKSFGPAAGPMGEFYELIDGANKPLMSTDLIGRMYLKCQAALALTSDPAIRRRIHTLALYTRYVELFSAYTTASGTERQAPFEELMIYMYRMRKTMMVHTYGLWRDIPARDKKSVTVPEGYGFNSATSPWKVDIEHTEAEIDTIITNGIANNPLFTFTPVSFSRDLVPATPLAIPSVTYGSIGYLRYTPIWAYVWNPNTDGTPKTFTFSGLANRVYTNRDTTLTLSTSGLDEIEMDEVTIPGSPTKDYAYTASLTTDQFGLHQIEIVDRGGAFTMLPTVNGSPYTFEVSMERTTRFRARSHLYFYVPKGTTVIGGYSPSGASDQLRDSTGTVRHTFSTAAEFFSVPVPPGQDGKLWKLHNIPAEKILMTVPPYVARHPNELLLPREVVEADSL